MTIRAYHTEYGCETGCCGHRVELDDGRGTFKPRERRAEPCAPGS